MAVNAAEIAYGLGTWAAELATTRDVLRRVLSSAGVTPCGKRGANSVYRARDVFEAWAREKGGAVMDDPDKLPPLERKAHYQAEHEKLRLQVERAELVPSIEVEQGQAQIFKILSHGLDTLPDLLERDVGLHPAVLAKVETVVDGLRDALYQQLIEDAEDDASSAAQD